MNYQELADLDVKQVNDLATAKEMLTQLIKKDCREKAVLLAVRYDELILKGVNLDEVSDIQRILELYEQADKLERLAKSLEFTRQSMDAISKRWNRLFADMIDSVSTLNEATTLLEESFYMETHECHVLYEKLYIKCDSYVENSTDLLEIGRLSRSIIHNGRVSKSARDRIAKIENLKFLDEVAIELSTINGAIKLYKSRQWSLENSEREYLVACKIGRLCVEDINTLEIDAEIDGCDLYTSQHWFHRISSEAQASFEARYKELKKAQYRKALTTLTSSLAFYAIPDNYRDGSLVKAIVIERVESSNSTDELEAAYLFIFENEKKGDPIFDGIVSIIYDRYMQLSSVDLFDKYIAILIQSKKCYCNALTGRDKNRALADWMWDFKFIHPTMVNSDIRSEQLLSLTPPDGLLNYRP